MIELRMSRFVPFAILDIVAVEIKRIKADSVVDLAYDRIRTMIEDGELTPGARVGQGELADAFGISRTTVREALHRLAGELVVEFQTNRGFFVTPIRLDAVVRRLEVRRILEPGIARLAAELRTPSDSDALTDLVDAEERADTPWAAHDASREFHLMLAQVARNAEFTRILESLWTVDIGRRLLDRRGASPAWQSEDVTEHRAIADAVRAGDGELAAELMAQHVGSAHAYWSEVRRDTVTA
jgi:DNA-binding GntR family transcriptional regulator